MGGSSRVIRAMWFAVAGAAAFAAAAPASAVSVVVPVAVTDSPQTQPPDLPLPPQSAITGEIDWVDPSGALAKTVAVVPLRGGALRFDAPAIDPRLRWAITLRQPGEPGLVYRSGPLDHLPTSRPIPVSVLDESISVLRGATFGSDALFRPDLNPGGRIQAGLVGVPGSPAVSNVTLDVQNQAWQVTVRGLAYRYRQAFDLVPSTDVGHPGVVIEARPRGAGVVTAPFWLRPQLNALRGAWRASIRQSLERFFADYVYILPPPPFDVTTYSVSAITGLRGDGSIGLRLNGGRVNGLPDVVIAQP